MIIFVYVIHLEFKFPTLQYLSFNLKVLVLESRKLSNDDLVDFKIFSFLFFLVYLFVYFEF